MTIETPIKLLSPYQELRCMGGPRDGEVQSVWNPNRDPKNLPIEVLFGETAATDHYFPRGISLLYRLSVRGSEWCLRYVGRLEHAKESEE